MGKETKFGLLVGVVFIVLFGVILGGRVGSAAGDHAPLPVGDSGDHQVIVDTILGSDDPLLVPVGRSLMMDDPSSVRMEQTGADPAEEPMPAPEGREPEASDPAEAALIGRLAFGPASVETPMPAPGPADPRPQRDEADDASAGRPASPAPAAPRRPVHLVAKGETLTTIARRYYGADAARLWRRIWEANKDRLPDPDRLATGQSLVIPGLPAETSPAEVEVADAAGTSHAEGDRGSGHSVTLDDLAHRFRVRLDEGEVAGDPVEPPPTYTVAKGDTFYGIARKVYGDASLARKLVRKNRGRVPDARRLRVGQKILLLEEERTAGRPSAPDGRVAQVARR
ncbi:MAG: LysM peptidoglycan-binding domain-containing protein [Planctomycetota bacterium]|nr:LysM peptidoglycan-binding domain-containing protein [Planctomycetota bacterium]